VADAWTRNDSAARHHAIIRSNGQFQMLENKRKIWYQAKEQRTELGRPAVTSPLTLATKNLPKKRIEARFARPAQKRTFRKNPPTSLARVTCLDFLSQ